MSANTSLPFSQTCSRTSVSNNTFKDFQQNIPGYKPFVCRFDRKQVVGRGGQYYNRSRSRSPVHHSSEKQNTKNSLQTGKNINDETNVVRRHLNFQASKKQENEIDRFNRFGTNNSNITNLNSDQNRYEKPKNNFQSNNPFCNSQNIFLNQEQQLNNKGKGQFYPMNKENNFSYFPSTTDQRDTHNIFQRKKEPDIITFNGQQSTNNSLPFMNSCHKSQNENRNSFNKQVFNAANANLFQANSNNQFFVDSNQHQNISNYNYGNYTNNNYNCNFVQNDSTKTNGCSQNLYQNNLQNRPNPFNYQFSTQHNNFQSLNNNSNFISSYPLQFQGNFQIQQINNQFPFSINDPNQNMSTNYCNNIQNPESQQYLQQNSGYKNLFSIPQNLFRISNHQFQECPSDMYQILKNNTQILQKMNSLLINQSFQTSFNTLKKNQQFQYQNRHSRWNDQWKYQRREQYEKYFSPEVIKIIIVEQKNIKKSFSKKANKKPMKKIKQQHCQQSAKTNQKIYDKLSKTLKRSQQYIESEENFFVHKNKPLKIQVKPFQISWRQKPVAVFYELEFINYDEGVAQLNFDSYNKNKRNWLKERQLKFKQLLKKQKIDLFIKGQLKFQCYPQNQEMKKKIQMQIERKYQNVSKIHLKEEQQKNIHEQNKDNSVSTAVSYSTICKSMNLKPMVTSLGTQIYDYKGKLQNVKLRYVYPLVLIFQKDPDTNQCSYKYSYSYYDGNKIMGLKIWNQYGEVKFTQILQIGPNPERRRLQSKKFTIGKFQVSCYEKWLDSPCECKFYSIPDSAMKYVKRNQQNLAVKTLCNYQAKPFIFKQISMSQPYYFIVQIDSFYVQDYEKQIQDTYLNAIKKKVINETQNVINFGGKLVNLLTKFINPCKWRQE